MEELFQRTGGSADDARGAVETWSALGPLAAAFLVGKVLGAGGKDPAGAQALWILERLEFSGQEMLAGWLGEGDPTPRLGAFLGIFDRMIMTAGAARALRDIWPRMGAGERTACLEAAAHWKRREFREPVLRILEGGPLEEVYRVLGLFPEIAQEGDAREVLRLLETRESASKTEQERLAEEVCRCLGRMADPLAIPVLEEWIHPKGFMDRLKHKSTPALQRAALRALGQYRSHQVRTFLEKAASHLDADLRAEATAAMKSVSERLSAE
jgi:hypothetical protein